MRPHPFGMPGENLPVALPRPSAMASAKLANSTVNQRIMAIVSVYPLGASFSEQGYQPKDTGQDHRHKTRNMTRFFLPVFSDKFHKESLIACRGISGRQKHFLFLYAYLWASFVQCCQRLLKRTKGKRREEAQRTDQQYHNNQQENKHSICGRQGARSRGNFLFPSQAACDCKCADYGQKPGKEHHQSEHIQKYGIRIETGKGPAVIAATHGDGHTAFPESRGHRRYSGYPRRKVLRRQGAARPGRSAMGVARQTGTDHFIS